MNNKGLAFYVKYSYTRQSTIDGEDSKSNIAADPAPRKKTLNNTDPWMNK